MDKSIAISLNAIHSPRFKPWAMGIANIYLTEEEIKIIKNG